MNEGELREGEMGDAAPGGDNLFTCDRVIPNAHSRAICALRFSPDGSAVASCSADKSVKLWVDGAPAGAPACTLEGHALGVNDVAWSPDGAFLASCSDDATIRVWDAATVRGAACDSRWRAARPAHPRPTPS